MDKSNTANPQKRIYAPASATATRYPCLISAPSCCALAGGGTADLTPVDGNASAQASSSEGAIDWRMGRIVAGILWLGFLISFQWLDDESFVLIMIPAFLMAMGTAGIASGWKQDRLGAIGLWLALVGAISFSEGGVVGDWFQSDLGWGLFMLGMLAHLAGLTLFGFANLKGRVFPRGNGVPLVMGLLTGLIPIGLAFILTFESDVTFILILGGLGVGWLLMGILHLAARREEDHAAGPS